MYVHHASLVPSEVEEGIGFPEIGVSNSCETPCVFWGLNPGPLQSQRVLLTIEHLSSPQPTTFKGRKTKLMLFVADTIFNYFCETGSHCVYLAGLEFANVDQAGFELK